MTSSDWKEKSRNYVKRLSKSLMGKTEFELPNISIKKPEVLIRDLSRIPKENWWKYAFSREPMNGRFSDAQRMGFYLSALECGKQQADKIFEIYGDIKPEELAQKLNLKVEYPQMPQAKSRILFAEFAEPNTVRVYKDGLEKGALINKSETMPKWLPEGTEIKDILIAHELYHVLEQRDKSIWSESYRISLWKIGPVENKSPIAVLSEIAAMAFAERMNHLNFSAYLFDAFLVYGYSAKAASALYDEMIAAAKESQSFEQESLQAVSA